MLTQEKLKKELSYNRETGVFTRLKSRGNQKSGEIVCKKNSSGYYEYRVFDEESNESKKYKAHRLAWLYEYGEFPNNIDHINGDRTDNRIQNLRDVSKAENNRNLSIYKNNKSGHIGVYFDNRLKKYCANIRYNGKLIHLGVFTSIDEAIASRKGAEITLGFHENHGKGKQCQFQNS